MPIVLFCLLVCGSLAAIGQPATLVKGGSQWQYLEGANAKAAVLNGWQTASSQEEWQTGVAPLRYGDGRGGTVLRRMRQRYSSVYLRQSFEVGEPESFKALDLLVNFDDGFVAYLNGIPVVAVNAPENPSPTSFASGSHESGQFETFELNQIDGLLRQGTNTLAIQAFNVNLTSTDFLIDAQLIAFRPDETPPQLIGISPESGRVNALSEITLQFSEVVSGVDAGDVLLNGQGAELVEAAEGEGDRWTFRFSRLELGDYRLRWRADHGITDLGRPANPFVTTGDMTIGEFQLVDDLPPQLVEIVPPPNTTVSQLKRVRLTFTEPVRDLSVDDIRINGQVPKDMEGWAAGPWTVEFDPIEEGPVTFSMRPRAGVTDYSPTPNALAAREWTYHVRPDSPLPDLRISEFLASNQSGLVDEDGDSSDWIEIVNFDSRPIDLAGWALTDDEGSPGRWTFPERQLHPNEALVVFASGKDRRIEGQPLHTNFKLGGQRGYLGLYSAELPRRKVHDFEGKYPEQRMDVSFGVDRQGRLRYFPRPTPGDVNAADGLSRLLKAPTFSQSGGHYSGPISVTLSASDPQTVIRYTLDASEPTLSHGMIYRQPIQLSRTQVIRAAVFGANSLPSRVATATYLIDAPEALRSLPTLSLVSAPQHLFGAAGIMERNPRNTSKRGVAWERPVSAEWYAQDPDNHFQIDCGLRIQGGDYIRGNYRYGAPPPMGKFSFRLYFRGAYGESRLDQQLIPRVQREGFEHLVLRAGMNDPLNPFIVDELIRRLYADMGQGSSQGILANLYLNGEYQGYYNPVERIDANFLQSRHGGGFDWDIIAQFGEIRQGDDLEWRRLLRAGIEQDLSDPENYAAVVQQMDIESFIDYIILNVYVDMDDWPHNNWRAARERVPDGLWRFYIWDGERAFGTPGKRGMGIFGRQRWPQQRLYTANNLSQGALAGSAEIARLLRSLIRNPDFRLTFADRVHRHYFNGGALTPKKVMERHEELSDEMRAVLPDINRYIPEHWIPNRQPIVMQQMGQLGLQRSDDAPRFNAPAGVVRDGFGLKMESKRGQIYYTTDNSDPREHGPGALLLYENPLPIDRPLTIKARSRVNGEWSALVVSNFRPESSEFPLQIVELMPEPIGGSEFEYVELLNTSGQHIELSWVRLQGIDFTFGFQAGVQPGQRLLLASDKDPEAFKRRYPRVEVDGWFAGGLANKGEKLRLISQDDTVLFEVSYQREKKAGKGYALERGIDDSGNSMQWTIGENRGGSPGRE